MKTNIWIYGLLLLLFATGCSKEEIYDEPKTDNQAEVEDEQAPEGYFIAKFSTSAAPEAGRAAAISGPDTRIQHLRYIVYKATGEYVKEKVIFSGAGSTTWPLPTIRDTLPEGSYKAVFLGNVESTLFPYKETEAGPDLYTEVLTGYKTSYADARIALPPVEFTSNTEYYWDTISFSTTAPNPSILLQRIIGGVELRRMLITGEDALNMLVENLVAEVNKEDILTSLVNGVLTSAVDSVLNSVYEDSILGILEPLDVLNLLDGLLSPIAGALDQLINPITQELVGPVVTLLHEALLEELIKQLGNSLSGNTDREGLIEHLTVILNPWNGALARSAIVEIEDFPKTIDFDLTTQDLYEGAYNFKYALNEQGENYTEERFVTLKTFGGGYNVNKISVSGVGLVGGVVVEGAVDDLLLAGALIDIDDPHTVSDNAINMHSPWHYSALDLDTGGTMGTPDSTLTLELDLGEALNLDDVLGGVLPALLGPVTDLLGGVVDILTLVPGIGGIVDGIIGALGGNIIDGLRDLTIRVELPVNVSLLNINNLSLSGSWSKPE